MSDLDPLDCVCCGEELVEDEWELCVACSPEVHTCTRRDAVIEGGEEGKG